SLFNLLSNASKFTEGGEVTLGVARQPNAPDPDWIVFTVKDTGIGMTPDQLRKVFQPFAQADASTAKRFGGTGLGLALTKRFAELMEGHVEATSEPGQGSTLTV